MEKIKASAYGRTYSSYDSDAISKVTFYDVAIEYETHYFAVVCFKTKGYGCREYLYEVSSNTQRLYAQNYEESAGAAFWNYIQPYAEVLNCSPDFD
ncbi:hypothetical protein [Saprospira grandis]|nr:hypothetical protein [Saprospira grandis]